MNGEVNGCAARRTRNDTETYTPVVDTVDRLRKYGITDASFKPALIRQGYIGRLVSYILSRTPPNQFVYPPNNFFRVIFLSHSGPSSVGRLLQLHELIRAFAKSNR